MSVPSHFWQRAVALCSMVALALPACDSPSLAAPRCSADGTCPEGYVCVPETGICAALPRSTCGDGVIDPTDECEDGNLDPGDGCSERCAVEFGWICKGIISSRCTTLCGDGRKAAVEECDDGNANPADGCSASCAVEFGWSCTGVEPSRCATRCGDGQRAAVEACDDGDLVPGDGCSETCTVEPGWLCVGDQPSNCNAVLPWADWPMPDSPTVYCTGGELPEFCPAPDQADYGQDGNYRLNVPDYDVDTPGVVADSVTGLMWQREAPAERYAWAEAIAYCRDLVLAGFDDWRLPSRIELVSILDYGRAGPFVDRDLFPHADIDVHHVLFWSSSSYARLSGFVWGVNFLTGQPSGEYQAYLEAVRCVR